VTETPETRRPSPQAAAATGTTVPAGAAGAPAQTAGADLVRRGVAPVAVALVLGLGLTAPAGADLVADPARPGFDAAARAVIARNESLRRAAATAPWLVRRAVDAIVALPPEPQEAPRPPETRRAAPTDDRPSADPDLDRLMRASPEAARDLFQLIKKAGSDKQQR
jgi:hypothetical protein